MIIKTPVSLGELVDKISILHIKNLNIKDSEKLKLVKDDFSFCVELPIKAKKANLKLTTSVAFERKRIAGKKKVNAFKDGFKILMSMIALYFI